jgi:hypothetical protein
MTVMEMFVPTLSLVLFLNEIGVDNIQKTKTCKHREQSGGLSDSSAQSAHGVNNSLCLNSSHTDNVILFSVGLDFLIGKIVSTTVVSSW